MMGRDTFLVQSSVCQQGLPENLQYVRGTLQTGTGQIEQDTYADLVLCLTTVLTF